MRIDGNAEVLVPIRDVVPNADGTIAVLQPQMYAVRFFDAEGRPAGKVGRRGAGPGEFRGLVRAGLMADTLWVYDARLDRVTLISPAHEFVRTFRVALDRSIVGSLGAMPFAVYPGGEMLVLGMSDGRDIFRVAADGGIRKIATLPEDGDPYEYEVGGSISIPFAPSVLWGTSPDGAEIAYAETRLRDRDAVVLLTVLDATGAVEFVRRYAFDTQPIPDSVVDNRLSERLRSIPHPELVRRYQDEVRSRIPPVYPPVTSLFVGLDHRVYLALRDTGSGEAYLILEPNGDPRATVAMAGDLVTAIEGKLWTLEFDELAVPSIIGYGIEYE